MLIAFFALWFVQLGLAPAYDTVNNIIQDVPADLRDSVLLVARYDELPEEPGAAPDRQAYIAQVNRNAARGNEVLREVVRGIYPHPVEFVSLADIPAYKARGYAYFVDMVLMPKQMTVAKKEAMVPAWIKYGTANKMFANRYTQFQFYFYIRDLRTDDAYVTTRLRGHAEAYDGIRKFLGQVLKDLDTH
ncbi:MAG: hypothetical protein SF053_02450 [Bacteroidia bacterium]|jgi:hypothetical protein|nr:hypothetical protein [Bacteroidia bacterium]